MNINICYLYYDLLNLYGENGNIKSLVYHLKEQGINVSIDYITVNDKKDFNKYDFIYIGSGTDKNLLIALSDLIKSKEKLKKYIENNKFILCTGNAIELFGDYIIKGEDKIDALSIFNYYTKYDSKRTVNDVVYKCSLIDKMIIGFENHYGKTYGINDKVIIKNNFIGSYIIGPILARNPMLCKYIIDKLVKSINPKFKLNDGDYEYEKNAYLESIKTINVKMKCTP